MNREMAIAQEMQRALMPTPLALSSIEKYFSMQISSCFICSAELSGDFWGCRQLNDEELAIYICDFSGHGLASAINTFRFHTLLEQQVDQYGRDPAYFINKLNQQMTSLLAPQQFSTLFYGVIHLGLNTLFYIAAGTPNPLILRENGSIEWIDSSGLPIGISASQQYYLQEIPFLPGDMLLCYSDSVTEQSTTTGELLDEQAITHIVMTEFSRKSNHLPNSIVEALLTHFRNNNGELPALQDDLTITAYLRNKANTSKTVAQQ